MPFLTCNNIPPILLLRKELNLLKVCEERELLFPEVAAERPNKRR